MFRSVRILVIALIVAVSLFGSASIASAKTIGVTVPASAPTRPPLQLPAQLLDISWE